ncbi:MAG: multidrug efflux RND transporter permease subunit [Phycisphaeraceae bacterium]|nr:multidrug efflux RND transporter permease subunit [Phycisphaeraceae bacterium]
MITTVFVRRPILASVLSVIIVLAGAVAGLNLPITQYPDIAPVQVTVTANYPGADAQTVADSVAAPIETQLNGADGLLYMQSTSSAAGQMTITAFFALGTNPDTAEVQVQNRVNLALPGLPDAVRQTGVKVQKRSSSTLLLIALYSPDSTYDEQYIGNYANLYILDALKRVDGANQAQIMGLPDLAMRIWLNPERMASMGITAADVKSAIARQNQQFSAGTVAQDPLDRPAEVTVPVVTRGRFNTPAEFESIIIRASAEGSAVVRLGDVARAEVGIQQYLLRSTVARDGDASGKPASFIAVYQQPGSNALAVADRVRRTMETLSASFPAGIEYAISFDTTKVVDASIKEVLVTLVVAIILVVLVTYLFLQNFRATLIPTIAIIVSVIGTFAGMLVLGFSLNLLTLLGLVLAIGIVCDDAIVVVENVERVMHEEKLNAKDATVKAMGEVIGPVIATTLVLCAVFIPVAFLGGTTGVLYKQFAVTIAISVSISSVVALTLTPALCGVLLKPRTSVSVPFRAFNWVLDTVTLAYGAGVRFVIRLAVLGLVLVAGIGYAIVYLFSVVPGSFVPEDDQGYVFAAVFLPDGATLNRTDDVAVRVERIFSEHPAVKYASKITGFSLIDNQFKNNAATIFVALRDFDERKGVKELSLEHLMLHARSRFATLTDGVAIPINPPAIPGLGSQGGFEFWLQNRGSDDPRQLASQVGAFLQSARERPELRSLNSTYNANARRLMIDVDRTRAETLGMPVEGIFDALQSLFGAAYVSQYSKYGRVWNVIVQAEASFRDEPGDIDRIFVRQRDGEMIPLSAVVDASYAAGPDLVQRFNGLPAAKITGDAAPGFSSGQSLAAMEATAAGVLPDTMSYAWAGQAFEQKQAGSTAVFAFAFGIVLVFLILAGQYERWTLPIAIITAVPFGVFGALVAVWISGRDNDVYFQVGLITLIGLSAKNAILIVEFAQVKHDQGLNAAEAAIEAAKLRLRPILMTSFASILGTIPLVIATGAGAKARLSIGTGILGGMIGATTLALIFVPMFYYLIVGTTDRYTRSKEPARA